MLVQLLPLVAAFELAFGKIGSEFHNLQFLQILFELEFELQQVQFAIAISRFVYAVQALPFVYPRYFAALIAIFVAIL